jgi:1-phosphofructokinase family hexose kinase
VITVAGFNTAIDRVVRLDALRPGEVIRANDEQVYPGGKGVHVAQTIAALGEQVQLTGLVDATHRNLITRRMSERGVLFHGTEIDEELRHCIAVHEANGQVTEILGQGPLLDRAARESLSSDFRRSVYESDLVVMSGSLPRGLAADTYAELSTWAHMLGKRCLIDASGEALRHASTAQPFLIKPNRDEAAALVGYAIDDVATAVQAARQLHDLGIAMPVITLGARGAVAIDDSGVWHAQLALADIRNTVGSGDCLLAGMAVGIRRGMSLEETLRLGMACGAANAQSEETGHVERKAVEALLSEVRVYRLA